MATERLK